ncbi:bacteriocin immunity protein [Streptomyces sp. CC219B]|uniref:bacteriocin immunity protein n=1 Tax=Streptomyces sp. CC219B TaxID=3044574 RepID=UPI0024A8A027|nr:bacteriocin immunity protein [Streptomyces sp. CC219B]
MSSLTRTDLIALVERIQSGEGTEEEQAELRRTLERNVLHPRVTDLIYWPRQEGYDRDDLTAEEIVDAALAYKPIAL